MKLSSLITIRQLLTSAQINYRGDQILPVAQIVTEIAQEERRLFELSQIPAISTSEVAKASDPDSNEAVNSG